MFRTLDKKLIILTQWSVRQCELFLYLRRDIIGKSLGVLNFCFAIVMLLSIIGAISQKKMNVVFIPAVIFFSHTRANLIIWKSSRVALWTGRIPRDIHERRSIRTGMLFTTIFMAIMCTIVATTATDSNISRVVFAITATMSSLITITTIEYFLCTVSIYPEK